MRIVCLQTPSPPGLNVARDWQGGFGTASEVATQQYGHASAANAFPSFTILVSATALSQTSHEVFFVDGQVEQLDLPGVLERLEKLSPDVLVSLVNLPSLDGDLALLKHVRERFPKLISVIVGPILRFAYSRCFKSGAVDYAILANPEESLPDLVGALESRSGKAHGDLTSTLDTIPNLAYGAAGRAGQKITLTSSSESRTDFSKLPYPAYHLLDMDRYYSDVFGRKQRFMAVWTSKGCPFSCAYYCPYPAGFGKKLQYKSPKLMLEELEELVTKYQVEVLLFRDQVFGVNREHTESILRAMIDRKLAVRWFCETRFGLVDLPLLRLMQEAGCREIHFGLESGDPEIFQKIGKPGVEVRILKQTIRDARLAGITPHTHVMVGLPGETWDTVKATLDMVKRVAESIHVSIATPYPGTQFHADVKRDNQLLSENWSEYTSRQAVVRTEAMSPEELVAAREYILRGFYRRNPRRIISKSREIFKRLIAGVSRT